MSKEKIDEIEKKKQELEAELQRIQQELDDSLDDVRTDVSEKLDPVTMIKKHPLPAFGISVLVGFIAGNRIGSSGKTDKRTSGTSDKGLSTLIWDELKKIATKKAVSVVTDYVENMVDEKIEKDTGSTNGAPSSS